MGNNKGNIFRESSYINTLRYIPHIRLILNLNLIALELFDISVLHTNKSTYVDRLKRVYFPIDHSLLETFLRFINLKT